MEARTIVRIKKILGSPEARQMHGLLRVTSGLSRYRILLLLHARNKGMKVKDIAEILGASPSRVSHQMRILKKWGLVSSHQEGREVIYARTRLRPDKIFPC